MRFAILSVALAACSGGAGAMGPGPPMPAVLDAYDSVVLGSTGSVAPTFDEVAAPAGEQPRRFRAWLGWAWRACSQCGPAEAATCQPCAAPMPYVCKRPSRVIACAGDEIISTAVSNAPQEVPPEGVYVVEGAWRPAPRGGAPAFEVTRLTPMSEAASPAAQPAPQ